MSSNSSIKDTIVIGGLSILGFMAGGKLGSMFGAVVGTIVCSMFNGQQPIEASGSPDNNFFTPSFCSNSNHNIDKSNENISIDKLTEVTECSICLESFVPSFLLWPCFHRCFCDSCYVDVVRKKVSSCPICRNPIAEFRPI
ncbi:RNA-binding protein MEX3B-like [Sipha flava]|uniref:RING finger protein n=1 Tax=Sipha flava TaxID=143950 RepID=A0A2S2QTR5_9HEMI|nr:RNA-binding protein MEX3B-like [Sipha flava]XP_025406989.1 RNA-binding protein MEX3B-like [Sipha flava]XP_025406990.1 RNA-binding protein MEX3B-like [Sipha flava]